MIRIMNLFAGVKISCFILTINSISLHGANFTQDFLASDYFIDKTPLLKYFFETEPRVFFTAPPGFGKTTILKMIKKFSQLELDNSTELISPRSWNQTEAYELFKNLKVGQFKNIVTEHLAQHPVIYLDFKIESLEAADERNVRRMFKEMVVNAVEEYRHLIQSINAKELTKHLQNTSTFGEFIKEREALSLLLKNESTNALNQGSNDTNLHECIGHLSRVLYKYYNKSVVLLIDNYDYIIRNSYIDSKGRVNLFEELLGNLLRHTLRTDEMSERIKYVMIGSVTSLKFNFTEDEKINAFYFYDDHLYSPNFGLTQNEVTHLIEKHNCGELDESIIKQYCGGYETKEMCQKIYNTSCVIEYLKNKEPDAMMAAIGHTNFIWKLFKDPEYLDVASKLLKHIPTRHGSHNTINFANFSKLVENNFDESFVSGANCTGFSYLIQHGFLSPVRGKSTFVVPNDLARQQLISDMRYYYEKVANIDLRLMGSYFYYIFVSIMTNTTVSSDLERYLNETLRRLKPVTIPGVASSKNHTKRIKITSSTRPTVPSTTATYFNRTRNPTTCMKFVKYMANTAKASLKFIHHSVLLLGALTNPFLKVIADYPLPINYDKSSANLDRRCVTCIVHENVALIVKNTDTNTIEMAEEKAHKFYNYSQPGVDCVRYLIVHVDNQNQVSIRVSSKKVIVQGNGSSKAERKKKSRVSGTTSFTTELIGDGSFNMF